MEKKYSPEQLKNENAPLFKCVEDGHKLVVPAILDHVKLTLKGQPFGTVAEHASFIRIVDDDTQKILFLELRTLFTNLIFGVKPQLNQIIFHESQAAYDEERTKLEIESRSYGKMGHTQYHGKNIGHIKNEDYNSN